MTNFLSETRGFTPVIDVMVEELGLIPASVYGMVWRYCQMKNRVCHASIATLARRLGLSVNTVRTHLQQLCAAGYLIDTTPNRRNAPHVYKDSGRAKIAGLVSASVTSSPTKEVSKRWRPVSKRSRPRSPRDGDEESIKESIKEREEVSPPFESSLYLSLAKACSIMPGAATDSQNTQLSQVMEILAREGATPGQMDGFRPWWNINDYRGKTAPYPPQVQEKWGAYMEYWCKHTHDPANEVPLIEQI